MPALPLPKPLPLPLLPPPPCPLPLPLPPPLLPACPLPFPLLSLVLSYGIRRTYCRDPVYWVSGSTVPLTAPAPPLSGSTRPSDEASNRVIRLMQYPLYELAVYGRGLE